MGNYENILALMQEYSGQDYRRAKLEDLQSMDRTPQFVQDADNCWLYSMFNNAYFNLRYKLSSAEVMEIKEEMRSYGINIEDGAGSPLSGAFIARYLSQKTGEENQGIQYRYSRRQERLRQDRCEAWLCVRDCEGSESSFLC